MSKSPIQLFLVDDHEIVRDGIRSYLEDDERFGLVGEAADGEEALKKLEELDKMPDIVLTDISMEPMDGLELSKRLRQKRPELKVVVLSMLNEHQYIRHILETGIEGYVLKTAGEEELKAAILKVYDGGNYFSQDVTKTVMESIAGKKNKKESRFGVTIPLTDREKEVLSLIVREYSNSEIADELFISPRTVEAHKRNLLEKTGSKNIAGLVLYAINNDII
ncbi:response regulator transcription factor [Halocola ammonii]